MFIVTAFVDLHIHTSASDGVKSPTEVVELAKAIELAGIAITDHDTVQGVEEAVTAGSHHGLIVVPGVEISCLWKDYRVHLLGYYINPQDSGLRSVLQWLRKGREDRLPKMLAKLREFKIDINQGEVEAEAQGETTGRPHLAKVMVRYGFVSSMDEAFSKYLAYGRPAYVDRPRPSIGEGIQTIMKAKGIPVIAHPLTIDVPLDQMFTKLTELGIQGIEYYYPYEYVTGRSQEWYSTLENQRKQLKRLAAQNNLILTGGSDYHGSDSEKVSLGACKVPFSALEDLQRRYEALFKTPP